MVFIVTFFFSIFFNLALLHSYVSSIRRHFMITLWVFFVFFKHHVPFPLTYICEPNKSVLMRTILKQEAARFSLSLGVNSHFTSMNISV